MSQKDQNALLCMTYVQVPLFVVFLFLGHTLVCQFVDYTISDAYKQRQPPISQKLTQPASKLALGREVLASVY
jgi:hypothetical protein